MKWHLFMILFFLFFFLFLYSFSNITYCKTTKYTLDPRLFKDISNYNEQHGELINKCVNLYLNKFNLKGYSTAILCETNKEMNESTTGEKNWTLIFKAVTKYLHSLTTIHTSSSRSLIMSTVYFWSYSISTSLYPILQLKQLFLYFPHYNTDYLDIIFLVILATVIAATAICTYVDRRYNTEGTLNYYKETANDKSMEFPTLFCCCCCK